VRHIALVHDHVGGKAGGGGGVRLMLELGLALVRQGHRVTVVCHDHQPDAEFAEASRELEIRAVNTGTAPWIGSRRELVRRFWLGMPKVARLVPDDVDVVNAHEWPGLHAGRLAAGRLGVPLVWTRNDETGWERAVVPEQTIITNSSWPVRLMRAALGWPDLLDARRAAAIVVLSTPQVRMVERSYRRPAKVVPLGPADAFFEPPDREEARRRLGVGEDVFLAVGAAILFPHRRFEDLIEAMALLGDEPGIEALIAGSDHADAAYSDRLTALIAKHGLEQRVRLPRRTLPESELKDVYAAADVLVFPNQRQTWGLAPLEALAGGTPAIVSSGAGVSEILEGRPGVRIVPPEEPAAIADALRGTRAERIDRVAETRAWLGRELTTDRYAEHMAEIYEEAIAGGGAARTAG
jgi:glycosyltransferase involved in cell wall biosynthesis